MADSFWLAMLARLSFGLWGFFPKLAVAHPDPRSIVPYQIAGMMIVAASAFLGGSRPQVHGRSVLLALLMGSVGAVGNLFLVTAISLWQGHGMLLALVAMALLSR